MPRLGVRASAAVLAMVVMAIATVIGSVLLLGTLRSSLVDEIDRANLSRADDIATQWSSENELIVLGAGFDNFTFAAVFEDAGFYEFTDESVELDHLYDVVDRLNEPFNASLDLLNTSGADNSRVLAMLANDPDPLDVPTVDQLTEEDVIVVVSTSLDPVDDTVRSIMIGAWVIGPLLVLLVGAVTWLLTGRSLGPVEAIRNEVENISSTDLHRRVPEPVSDDEIGRLAGTMNVMLERLEVSNRAQQQFVSDASHELRSPLASMSSILDVAERHGTDDEWPETARDLRKETERMRRMVDDLLALARVDSGHEALASASSKSTLVDLDDVVLDVTTAVALPDHLTLDTSGVSAGLVRGHTDQLHRAIDNLISNAARHATSTVRVVVTEATDRVLVVIEDDGPGVPPEHQRSIFDRFVRLDDARSRDVGGSGLGLAITKEIVTAHDGSIEVGTSDLGGARFTVSLPAHGASEADRAVESNG